MIVLAYLIGWVGTFLVFSLSRLPVAIVLRYRLHRAAPAGFPSMMVFAVGIAISSCLVAWMAAALLIRGISWLDVQPAVMMFLPYLPFLLWALGRWAWIVDPAERFFSTAVGPFPACVGFGTALLLHPGSMPWIY